MPLNHTHEINPDLPCYACMALEEQIECGALGGTLRRAFPNPDRPLYWEGEEGHFRSDVKPGDVCRTSAGELALLTYWCNAVSSPRHGRLAYLRPLITYPGETFLGIERCRPVGPGVQISAFEVDLQHAAPGDVGRHIYIPPGSPVSVTSVRHQPCNWRR